MHDHEHHAPAAALTPEQQSAKNTIEICLLVSAIFNFIVASGSVIASLALILSIVGIVVLPCTAIVAGALIWLGVVELKTRQQLIATDDPAPLLGRLQTLGVLEIVAIIFQNVGSLVCGIILLVNLPKLRAR